MQQTSEIPAGVIYEDGMYRWESSINLWKNASVLWPIYRAVLIFFGLMSALVLVIAWQQGQLGDMVYLFQWLGFVLAVFAVVMAAIYLAVGLWMGGQYHVRYEMDENGIRRIPLIREKKQRSPKYVALSLINRLKGAEVVPPHNYLVKGRNERLYAFDRLQKVAIRQKAGKITLHPAYFSADIYPPGEGFLFVRDHILNHCPRRVKIIRN